MANDATPKSWDDYYIPGTTTLRNKFVSPGNPFGQPDPELLRQLEEDRASIAIIELLENPIPGDFDYAHMKAIHRHIFQDVYDWAGEERTAPIGSFMTKNGHSYYPAGEVLTEAAEAQYRKLAAQNYLRGLNRKQFVTALAESWGEINVIHSFREGNTRSQFVFFHQLAHEAGWMLDISAFAPGKPLRDEFVAARFHSQDTGSNARLAEVLEHSISADMSHPEQIKLKNRVSNALATGRSTTAQPEAVNTDYER